MCAAAAYFYLQQKSGYHKLGNGRSGKNREYKRHGIKIHFILPSTLNWKTINERRPEIKDYSVTRC